jgi:hypothetical protein
VRTVWGVPASSTAALVACIAEYGGLAGVVVTTRRGTGRFHGTGFYDYNGNELNARTFAQAIAKLERDNPVLDTSRNRWGATLGGKRRLRKRVRSKRLGNEVNNCSDVDRLTLSAYACPTR